MHNKIKFLLLSLSICIFNIYAGSPLASTQKYTILSGALGTTYILDTPGRYILNDNLRFNSTTSNQIGIKITSNNVILDLQEFTVSQDNSASNFTLINIAAGLTNITIKHGALENCSGVALKVDTSTKITLANLAINNCQTTGIQLTNCNNSLITDTYVTNCTTRTSSELSGICLDSCVNIKITECASNNHINSTADGLVNGFKFISCANCTISNCNSNTNQAACANGYLSLDMKTCIFKHCKANNNLAAPATNVNGVAGFNLVNSINCRLEDCHALANSSSNNAYGFKLLNSQYNKLNNCEATYNKTTCSANLAHAYGFYCNHTDELIGGNNILSCQATGNIGGAHIDSFGVGFGLGDGAKYTSICDCIADYNNSAIGTGCGIYLNGATYCNIKNNRVITNTGNSPAGGYGIYDTTTNSINLYMQNFAFGNGKTDNSVINNYKVFLAPDTNLTLFPSLIAYLNNFNNLTSTKTANYNIEIIERP
jgi:parallel beta-helix repeat protein